MTKAIILDERSEGDSRCFLCRIPLEDYLDGLPDTYQDYDVQREIVSNVYLDRLVETVIERRHIPPIVLVVDSGKFSRAKNVLDIESFKILDGLQRTFRLQAIRETIIYCLREIDDPEEYLSWSKFKFSRKFSAELREMNSNTDVLRSVLVGARDLGEEGLLDTLRKNGQWFEVWTDLSPDEEVRKMLTLNAGHKPVKTRHQLELLFLNLLPLLKADEGSDFRLVREKEVSSTQFSKKRDVGSFHFAHIISSLLSFYAGKPIAPSTGLIQNIQTNDTVLEDYADFITPSFLKEFVRFLVHVDRLISQEYEDVGILWMGREVSLAGLFGALGFLAQTNENSNYRTVMDYFVSIIEKRPKVLNLEQFEDVRNNLDLSKINLGNANRAAVFSAVKSILADPNLLRIDWRGHFDTEDTK